VGVAVGVGVRLPGSIGKEKVSIELLATGVETELLRKDGTPGSGDETGTATALVNGGVEELEVICVGLDEDNIDVDAELELEGIVEDIREDKAIELSDKIVIDCIEIGGNNEMDGMAELSSWTELDGIAELDNVIELDNGTWLEGGDELDDITELETTIKLDWIIELEASIELEDKAELMASTDLESKPELDAGIVLEYNAELDDDTVLEYNTELEAGTGLEMYEDVKDTPIPPPRIDDCSGAVLRAMLDCEIVGLL
jgi:hypothetical protein